MDPTLLIAILAIAALAVLGVVFMRRRRSEHLQSKFGPEYEHAVDEMGGRAKAEAELARREKRVEKLHIHPLTLEQREQFAADWQRVQAEFVDDPNSAITHADALLGRVMSLRGYPVEDFDQVAGDISVDHPQVVEHYREGHEITARHLRGEADTEQLRQAMVHYRALFEELVTDSEPMDAKQDKRAEDPQRTH